MREREARCCWIVARFLDDEVNQVYLYIKVLDFWDRGVCGLGKN